MSFLDEYQKLFKSLPQPVFYGGRNEHVAYCNNIWHSYDSYHCFNGGRLKNVFYTYNSTSDVNCVDCDHCFNCELCYECFEAYHCYNSSYLEFCEKLINSHFSIHCQNSQDLFGCVELKHKQYCIFNVQYSKEEYEKKLKELMNQPVEKNIKTVETLKRKLPQPSTHITQQSENCFGDYIFDSINCQHCFFTTNCENSAHLFDCQYSRDSYDSYSLHECELCYESLGIGHSYNCSQIEIGDCLVDCHYCTNCYNSENLFGCVNLRHKKFCILNVQYSRDEYFKKVNEIKKELGWPIKIK